MEQKFIAAFKEAMEMEDKGIAIIDNFRDYENWNSLRELSVLAMLDSEFGIEIEMEDFNKLITVQDLFNLVKAQSK
jgi:acyl carrier protein